MKWLLALLVLALTGWLLALGLEFWPQEECLMPAAKVFMVFGRPALLVAGIGLLVHAFRVQSPRCGLMGVVDLEALSMLNASGIRPPLAAQDVVLQFQLMVCGVLLPLSALFIFLAIRTERRTNMRSTCMAIVEKNESVHS